MVCLGEQPGRAYAYAGQPMYVATYLTLGEVVDALRDASMIAASC
jgi:hypothetical protein